MLSVLLAKVKNNVAFRRFIYELHRLGKYLPKWPPVLAREMKMVVVEVTTCCILQCRGCVRTIMAKNAQWEDRHISVEAFTKIVDSLPHAELFIPQGIGEPTLHPRLPELIRIAHKSGKFKRIEINTNGLVKSKKYYAELFDAGLTYLTVSVDTLDPVLIDLVRAGTDILRLESEVKELGKQFPGRVGIRITVSKFNAADIPLLLKRLNALGSFQVWLQPFFDMGYNEGVLSNEECKRFLPGISSALKKFKNLKITPEQFMRSHSVCRAPWNAPAITIDGHLKPCCLILHQEDVHFGNVLTEPCFESLWISDAFEKCRKGFLRASPVWCRNCPFYVYRS